MSATKKHVVILGAGYAGTAVAKDLSKSKHVRVTIVDQREGQISKISGLRSAVAPAWEQVSVVPRDKLLNSSGEFVQAGISQVTDTQVTLDNGRVLDFDYLVAATGAHNSSPGEPSSSKKSLEELKQWYAETSAAIKKASNIVIIGGGVVGVELVGEIRHVYPTKKITIIHAGSTFVNNSKPPFAASFHTAVQKQLKKMKIDFILSDKANLDFSAFGDRAFLENPPDGKVTTASGKAVPADLVIRCTGTRVNSSFYPSSWVDDSGHVVVNEYLQVKEMKNVFAVGDVTNLNENKMAYYATSSHAPTVAGNIERLAAGKQANKTYKAAKMAFMIVPFGPYSAAIATSSFTFKGWLPSFAKSRSLFLSMAWGANNQPTPNPPLK